MSALMLMCLPPAVESGGNDQSGVSSQAPTAFVTAAINEWCILALRSVEMAPEIPTIMLAWRKHKGNVKPVWEEVPVPKPSETQILVKLLASGVCRSDISLLRYDTQPSWFQDRYILGHEGCGRIVQFGASVGETALRIGDIVALHAVPGCRNETCTECDRDLSQICERGHHSGIGQDGFYAPYATIDIRGAVPVPPGVLPAQAAVATDAVATAYHAIFRRGEIKKHETVFLFGLGGLGMNALQLLLYIGAEIVVSDTKQACLDRALSLGVPSSHIVPLGTAPQEFVLDNFKDIKIDVVLDFVGKHQTFQDAQNIVRRGGRLLCIGSLDNQNMIEMKLATRKRLSFIFSYGSQAQDLPNVLELIATKKVEPRVQSRPLKDLQAVLAELETGEVEARVVLTHS
ncbi:hypothetical protein LTR49_007568 [Elasticomyces elasticus]|nr:hypothetical protein LTR49_007568 [Elasticomyces elasticus]KAK5764596.1 hypothetical protein LTS12_005329 [Elasticomyces elasticus]